MNIDRLVAIVTYLLKNGTVSAAELAVQFGVSRRTIVRDMEVISRSSALLRSIRGANGGYAITEDWFSELWTVPRTIITADDKDAIYAALCAVPSAKEVKRYKEKYEKFLSLFPVINDPIVIDGIEVAKHNAL